MRYRLFGSIGSPYALKLRSLLRYKRLSFDWIPATLDWLPENLPHPPLSAAANAEISGVMPKIVPAIYFPRDKSMRNESTTLAYLLDREHRDRPVIPADPGIAFLAHLLEDMADEWLVKIAFQLRWGSDENSSYKSRIVVGELLGGGYEDSILINAAAQFTQRQRSRMALVGCTETNAPLIQASFEDLLDIMSRITASATFLFGDSPTLADFGFYGQLQSLATDPTAWRLIIRRSPNVFSYLQHLEDSSGIEPVSLNHASLPHCVPDLMRFAAKFYLPYLKANALALNADRPIFTLEVAGLTYSQAPFKYHWKCYEMLREEYRAIPNEHRTAVAELLYQVGALEYF